MLTLSCDKVVSDDFSSKTLKDEESTVFRLTYEKSIAVPVEKSPSDPAFASVIQVNLIGWAAWAVSFTLKNVTTASPPEVFEKLVGDELFVSRKVHHQHYQYLKHHNSMFLQGIYHHFSQVCYQRK